MSHTKHNFKTITMDSKTKVYYYKLAHSIGPNRYVLEKYVSDKREWRRRCSVREIKLLKAIFD